MPQPTTGVSFKAAGLAYMDALRVRRGGNWQILIRDYDGSNTNISPGSDFGSPFSVTGDWRDDYFAIKRTARGQWVYNNRPNLGFYPIGYIMPNGIERTPQVRSDPLRALQSMDAVRNDMTERDKTLVFTPLERNLVVDAIRFNQPLRGVLERAAGDDTYFAGEGSDDEPLRRQVLVAHEDRQGTQAELNVFPFPRCVLTDLGSEKGNRTDADAAQFTLSREICPFFVNADGVPLVDGRWTSGGLWKEATMAGLTFVPPAPVATPQSATTARLVLGAPIGGVDPYTYAVEKSPTGVDTWTAATIGTSSVAGDELTVNLTGLTTATDYYFRAVVEDENGDTATSAVSNKITTP